MESLGRRTSVLAVVLLICAALAAVSAGATHERGPGNESYAKSMNRSEDCEWEHREALGPVCDLGSLLKVRYSDGSVGYTHGSDPALDEPLDSVSASGSTDAIDEPSCARDLADGYYGVFIYAVAHDDTDNYDSRVSGLREMVEDINSFLSREAERQGERIDLRFRCNDLGEVEIRHEVLPTDSDYASFSTIVGDLKNKGYDDPHRKYWIWYDNRSTCSCLGQGNIYDDDRLVVDNWNNGREPMYGINYGYWSRTVSLHENGHNLGAVQHTAPDSTWAHHCNDGQDTMCYPDGGENESYDPWVCTDHKHFDCDHDTYFDPTPEAGTYLANHWNLGSELNRFYEFQGANGPPAFDKATCSPDPVGIDTDANCTVRASDDSAGVYYRIDWDDGNATRSPEYGYVANDTDWTVQHEWTRVGTYEVSIQSYDWAGLPGETTQINQTVVNHAPVLEELDCTSQLDEGSVGSCTFQASDDSDGVHYEVDWGDDTGVERVPASGTVAPSETMEASHRFTEPGEHEINVTVVDDEASPKSDTGTHTIQVQEVPCTLDERGTVPAGLIGIEFGSYTTAYVGIPSECKGEPFTLEGSTGSDFDICFYKGQEEQGCYRTYFDEEGTIPREGSRSEIYLYAGAASEYHLTGPDA